jgi:hypothetical protein
MAFDISKTTSVVKITNGTNQPQVFVRPVGNYFFNADGTFLEINLGGTFQFEVAFADLTVGGAAPADVTAAYTALATVFS